MILLIHVSNKYEGYSFSDLGKEALGMPGKYICDFTLAVSQAGFVTAYTVFILQNFTKMIENYTGVVLSYWQLSLICFLIYTPLTWVRRIQKFSKFHVFADIAILTMVIVISCYTGLYLYDQGKFSDDVEMINSNSYLVFVGTAIYSFEGIGIVLPVKDTCKHPKDYPYIVALVIFSVFTFYIMFGSLCYFSYGGELLSIAPMITKLMPSGSIYLDISMLMFVINIFISYPLVIHPTNMVVESYLFYGVKQSWGRKWMKNVNRTVI